MNTQYRKNLKAVLEASKSYCDESIANLEWQIGTYNYDVSTDSNVDRIKTLPSDTYKSQIDYIGGKTVKYNQFLREINSTNWGVANSDYGSVSFNGNEIIYTNTVVVTGYNAGIKTANYISTSDFPNGHKGIVILKAKASEVNNDTQIGFDILNRAVTFSNNLTTSYQQFAGFFVSNSSNPSYICYRNNPVLNANLYIRDIVLVDLTDKFGAGNEPSTVETAISLLKANGYKLDGTDTYSTGSLKHAITTSVVYSGNYLPIADNINTNLSQSYTVSTNGNEHTFTSIGNYGRVSYYISNLTVGKKYTISYSIKKTSGSNTTQIRYADNTESFNATYDTYAFYTLANFTNVSYTFTATSSIFAFNIYITAGASYGDTIVIKDIMLNEGSTALPYTPYVAPITKAIPSQVLADVRYGLGFDNTNYNHLDSDGHLRGSYLKITYDGSNDENWGATTSNRFYINPTGFVSPEVNIIAKLKCDKLTTYTKNIMQNYDYSISGTDEGSPNIYVRINSSINDVSALRTWLANNPITIVYLATAFDQDYSQYFDTNWNKVNLDNLYASCEMVCDEPIDMPNSITNLIKEVKA